ncbi:alpha/beta hydrolase [Paenarthrobacter sp. NPDC056912]|uniref:alpha/beta hydrolase n=1 Tax=Paenarthrobacter sp. NPDC056912 TaxID=3345965 RepID=UPI00366E1287
MYEIDTSVVEGWPDPAALEEAAAPLLEHAQGVVNVVQAAASEWSGLADVYRAPEAAELVAAFGKPVQVSEALRTGVVVVYRALLGYADTVRDLNRRRGLLLDEIEAFYRERDTYLERMALMEGMGDESASMSGTAVAYEADDLQRRVRSLAAEHEQAENDCARRINSVPPADGPVPAYYDAGTATDLAVDRTRSRLQYLESTAEAGAAGSLEMLALLKSLTPGQLLDYGMAEADFLRSGLASPPPVDQVRDWWAGLSPEQQAALMVAAPGVIGNLNGIPYKARAKANRINLDAVFKDPRTRAEDKAALQVIYKALKPADKLLAPPRSIVSFTPDENGKPLVAVAIGDLDTATNVTWNVPGMKTTVADGLESWTKSAQDLYDGQVFADLISKDKESNSVVSWVGYDSPEEPPSGEVLSTELAKAGGAKLAAALDGFTETRATPEDDAGRPRLNVVAHSYGTTTASYALKATRHEVATATFFGSAGIEWREIGSAADLHVAKDPAGKPEVYVTAASEDRVAPLGILGSGLRGREGRWDPTGDWFGGKNFSSGGGYDPDTGTVYTRTTGHDAKGWAADGSGDTVFAATSDHGYLDPRTESAHNIALTSTGRGHLIKELIPLRHEARPGYGGMDYPTGPLIERDLTPEELTEERSK